MKILTVVGARPQFIKAAAFSAKLRERTDWKEVIVHTGQHFDANMSSVFFEEMNIPRPDYQLEVNSLPHGAMTGRMLEKLEEILMVELPDLVLVYGDTNSTLAGALTAKKLHIKIAHVEAGLRSYNEQMPEEINRILTDRISDYLFVPATAAKKILLKEGIAAEKIFEVGDIMFDALKLFSRNTTPSKWVDDLPENFVLLTLHRQENVDDPNRLQSLVRAINTLNELKPVITPLHPRTQKQLKAHNLKLEAQLLQPVGYIDMLHLISRSDLVLTDSGGLQKEAFYLKKFCISLREQTEWTELVALGVNELCGSSPDKIMQAFDRFQNMEFTPMPNPYGGGNTAAKIIEVLSRV